MKTFFKLLVITVLVTMATLSIARVSDSGKNIVSNITPSASTDEYVFMQQNKMMLHWFEKDVTLGATYPCTDSSFVSVQGLVTRKDGTTIQMKNGDKVYSDGKYEPVDASSIMKD